MDILFYIFLSALILFGAAYELPKVKYVPSTPISQRITDKFAPEHVTCFVYGNIIYDGDTTKDGVMATPDGKIGFHDLKTGRGVVVNNPFCITTIPPDKYPDIVPNPDAAPTAEPSQGATL
jgi:hypothetical protein